MKKTGLLISNLVATVACVLVAAPALAEDDGISGVTTVTDSRGRPPFARVRVSTSTDFARLEETAVARVAAFRGRPPFVRHAAYNDAVIDLSRFEEAENTGKRRRGPPGKSLRR